MSPVCSLQQAGGEVSNCGDCKKQCREDVVAHVVPLFGIPYVLLLLSSTLHVIIIKQKNLKKLPLTKYSGKSVQT